MARENFMEKLKREREESTQSPKLNSTKSDVSVTPVVVTNPFRLDVQKKAKIIQTFNSDDEESSVSNDRSEAESVIKRKSKLFIENGKVNVTTCHLNPLKLIFIKKYFRLKSLHSTQSIQWYSHLRRLKAKPSMRNRKKLTRSGWSLWSTWKTHTISRRKRCSKRCLT